MTGRVRDMILDPQLTGQLPEVIAEGVYYGMQTFDQHLLQHLQAGRVTMEDAMRVATSPHDFKLMVAAPASVEDEDTADPRAHEPVPVGVRRRPLAPPPAVSRTSADRRRRRRPPPARTVGLPARRAAPAPRRLRRYGAPPPARAAPAYQRPERACQLAPGLRQLERIAAADR